MAGRNGKASVQLFSAIEKSISSYVMKPLLSDSVSKAVILAYHNIPLNTDDSVLQPDSVPLEKFEQQMRFLSQNNFNIISLRELVSLLRNRKEIPHKTVVITFDDGYKTVHLNALPVLQKYNLPAMVFLAVDYIGAPKPFVWLLASASKNVENLTPLTWHDILELKRVNIDIGSHTCSHRFLPTMRPHDMEKEVVLSGDIIHDNIGTRPQSFALPFSFPLQQKAWPHFRSMLFDLLERGGYGACCTSTRGTIDTRSHPYSLGRFFITRYDDLSSFHAKALGAFSWTRFPQVIYQRYFKNYDTLIDVPNA